MSPAGYSGTPLAKKLGIKSGFRVCVKNYTGDYQSLVNPLPDDVEITTRLTGKFDLIHFFTKSEKQYLDNLEKLISKIHQHGMIWVSWPKKASKVKTDMTETVVRQNALKTKLVDVKVCAVDEVWSGLKLVIRKELRETE